MYSLVEKHGKIYLREYCTYDRPDYTLVCSLSDLGISSIKDLPIREIDYGYKKGKNSGSIEFMSYTHNMDFYTNRLIDIFKISLENKEILNIIIAYGYIRIYASKEMITYIKMKGIEQLYPEK